jgi:hypothetical protein
MLDENANTIKRNTEALIDASNEGGLEVNTEKTKHIFMFNHQIAGQNHDLMTPNKSLKNVAKLKCLGMTVTNYNCIYEAMKSRLNWGNTCYHSFQNFLSFHLLCENKENVQNYVFTLCLVWV